MRSFLFALEDGVKQCSLRPRPDGAHLPTATASWHWLVVLRYCIVSHIVRAELLLVTVVVLVGVVDVALFVVCGGSGGGGSGFI